MNGVRIALLTPAGRGALSVVGVAGPGAIGVVARLFTPRGSTPLIDRPSAAIVFGTWRSLGDGPGEDLVVVRRGSEALEIHCHGGLAAAEAVLASIEQIGGRRQSWPEWMLAGGMPEIEVEARTALARAGGPKAARILSRQLAGCLEADIARVESLGRTGREADADALVDRLVRAARIGLRLLSPWRVVVAGAVNAGKSSLVNALAGHARCIVSPQAGTTRDLVETRIVLDGWEVELVDTAGLRGLGDEALMGEVEQAGVARAVAACRQADLVVRVSAGTGPQEEIAPPAPGELLVFSKADLAGSAARIHGDGIWTSVVTGQGVEELATRIVRRLVPEEIDDPGLLAGGVPFTPRQLRLVEGLRPRV